MEIEMNLQEQIRKIRERNVPEVAEMLINELTDAMMKERREFESPDPGPEYWDKLTRQRAFIDAKKDTSKEDDEDAKEKLPE